MNRIASPIFAGRAPELAQLDDAFEACASGSPRVVLVSADAGGGKTRLLQEFANRVASRATVLVGGCTDQSESGLPYAPFTAAIRGLLQARSLGEVVALIGTSSAGDLAWLLPEFGAPRALPDVAIVRSRLFEVVRLLTEKLAREQPLVWMLEDLHWSDAGTRDLLRYLAANLTGVRALVLVSHRSDALHREHPLRRLLAELGRLPATRVLPLPRLTRPEMALQLRGILGREPDAATVNTVFARSEGMPLYVEALMGADGQAPHALPDSLNELLLWAVRELPAATQAVLRAASLGGSVIAPSALAAVMEMSEADVEQQLRPALAANVLVKEGDGCVFRHRLIREAIDGDMLAGERRRLHAAHAAAIAAQPASAGHCWATLALARHWHQAGEDEAAFTAAWAGAQEAGAATAYVEQLEMLELMLDVWPRVTNAASLVGVSHLDVVEQAANAACWAARPERGMRLTEMGLAQARQAGDTERQAALLGMQRAPMRQQQLLPGQLDDLEAALRLTANPRLRVECLAQLCRALLLRERLDDAEQPARELADMAARTDDPTGHLDARITRAMLDLRRGLDTDAELQAAVAACRRASGEAVVAAPDRAAALAAMASPWGWLEVLAMHAQVEADLMKGRHDRAAERAAEATARCLAVGQAGYIGASIASHRARALQCLGRWGDAIDVLEQALAADPTPFAHALLLLSRSEMALLRGDLDLARRGLSRLRGLPQDLLARAPSIERLEIDLLMAEGEAADACDAARNAVERCRHATPKEAWPLLAAAMRAHADVRADAAAIKPLAALARRLPRPGPVEAACAALAMAEHGRLAQRPTAAPWLGIARQWADLSQPFEQAYALMRAGAVTPDRAVAADCLQQAERLASALGAEPLLQRIRVVAGRRRVGTRAPLPNGHAPAPFALTARELDVLRLLAEGQTNRQIGSALVISAKTASVHVTNILAKLDVRTRGAAAAVAHRLGLSQ
jgi:DNA-binding CsgD family transcriptional regulator/tetratricopeptide (TPR) repeat protein